MGSQAVPSFSVRSAPRSRTFYPAIAFFAAAVIFAGFARTYYLKWLFGTPDLPLVLHLHGAVMTGWMVLLIVQTLLVARHRTDIHRRLGVAGGILACGVVVVGLVAAIRAVRLGRAPAGGSPLSFFAIPFGDLVLFSVLVAIGLYYRRRPELHKRLMLIATIAILPPGIARWPVPFVGHNPIGFFGVTDLILVGCALYDYAKTRRWNAAYVYGGLLVVASHPLRLLIAHTRAWMAFARWMTGA